MSKRGPFFCCSKAGYDAYFVDADADAYATAIMEGFQQSYHESNGRYPSIDEATDAYTKALDRFEQGDVDEWDWADHRAFDALAKLCEGTGLEAERRDRIILAKEFRGCATEARSR